jgi:hypothetical protein
VSKNAVVSDGKTGRLRPTLVRRIALGCGLVLLAVAFKFLFLHLGSTSSRAGTPEAWVEIKNEKAALSLEKTSFAGQQAESVTYVHGWQPKRLDPRRVIPAELAQSHFLDCETDQSQAVDR